MPELELYERKVLSDEELPVEMQSSFWNELGIAFPVHWHEHIELHYILQGTAEFHIDQQILPVQAGDLLVVNPNELHTASCTQSPYKSYVLIFDLPDLSRELAKKRYRFFTLVRNDPTVQTLISRIFSESAQQKLGHKALCRALITEFLVYLCRHYADQPFPELAALRRGKALERLNPVLQYVEAHYPERMTVEQLADMMHLSEDRFAHLFREGVQQAPLQYINEVRLRKAMALLRTHEYTVTAVAEAVGFTDYNHFGRLFRKRYGFTPNQVRLGKDIPENSGIV